MTYTKTAKSLTWIKDKDGKEYVCDSRDVKESKFFEDLSKEEKTCVMIPVSWIAQK